MAPRPPAKPPPKSAAVKSFEQAYEPALDSEEGRRRLNGVIKQIKSAEELAECLDAYCRKFDPAKPPKGKVAPIRARVIGYALFIRAAELVGPLNPLRSQLAALETIGAPPDDAGRTQLAIWARRWCKLEENERRGVRQQIARTLADAAKARPDHILPYLVARYRTDKGVAAPTTEQLLDFDLGSAAEKAEFEAWIEACSKPWRARYDLKNRPSLATGLSAVDEGFAVFRKRLDESMKTPLDFFRMLKYVRERTLEGDVWGFDHEIYLEVAAKGLRKALADWKIESAYKPRAFVGDDNDFLIAGIRPGERGRSRELMRLRLEPMRKGPAQIQAESQSRRRLVIAGAYWGLDYLDELELMALAQTMDENWRTRPLDVVSRFILAPNARDVFNDRFWINQKIGDVFTVVWIDYAPDGNRWAYVELHAIPGVIYRGNGSAVSALNEQAFYKALAKNAKALTAFMLAYLEVLGWVLDIATAGISGGFRHILWEFAKERLKEKMVEKGMTALGIDNPWLQSAAGFGVNFVRFPKGKPQTPAPVEAPPSPRGVPDRPNGAEAAAQARAAAIPDRIGAPIKDVNEIQTRQKAGEPQPEVVEPALRPVSYANESASRTRATKAPDPEGTPITDIGEFKRRKAAQAQLKVADPAVRPSAADEAAARARAEVMDARTNATGQKPRSVEEIEAIEAAKISDLSKIEAQRADVKARQQASMAESGTMARASTGGGGGGQTATAGYVIPAASRGTGGVPKAARGTPPTKPPKPPPLPPRASKLLTPESTPLYATHGALNTDAGKTLAKRGLKGSKLTRDQLSSDHYLYQRIVAGVTQWKLKLKTGHWRTKERFVEPDGVAHAKEAKGKLDLIEAKWEGDHIAFDNWDYRSMNWKWAGDKIDQMKRYAEAVRQNPDILHRARYCCSSKTLYDIYSILREQALPRHMRQYVAIELDPRAF